MECQAGRVNFVAEGASVAICVAAKQLHHKLCRSADRTAASSCLSVAAAVLAGA